MAKQPERPQVTMMRTLGYVTPSEAARNLGIHYQTIRTAISNGYLEFVLIGNRKYVPEKALADYFGTAKLIARPEKNENHTIEVSAQTIGIVYQDVLIVAESPVALLVRFNVKEIRWIPRKAILTGTTAFRTDVRGQIVIASWFEKKGKP